MKKAQRKTEQAFEIVIICTRCKTERSIVVTWETITKPPKPCHVCGGQDWVEKKVS